MRRKVDHVPQDGGGRGSPLRHGSLGARALRLRYGRGMSMGNGRRGGGGGGAPLMPLAPCSPPRLSSPMQPRTLPARHAAQPTRVRGSRPPPPPPPPRTEWTRRVPHPVLIGHAASPRPRRRAAGQQGGRNQLRAAPGPRLRHPRNVAPRCVCCTLVRTPPRGSIIKRFPDFSSVRDSERCH